MSGKCCPKCDARQIGPVLGGADCWDANCVCHKKSILVQELREAAAKYYKFKGPKPVSELLTKAADAIAQEAPE